MRLVSVRSFVLALSLGGVAAAASGQPANQDAPAHSHGNGTAGWTLAADGVLFATYDRQGGLRGETTFPSQNWVMAMGIRTLGGGMLTLSGMLSAEPLTVGLSGYPELFQEGEAYRGLQITDRQHPHDLFMQLAATWRRSLGDRVGITIAGGPVGEAALGPVAFMHRLSASENPTAPLSHHIFDSTHIVDGVVSVGLDRGPLGIEGSIFRGREPDEDRYDLDLGALDSWSGRVWFRPGKEWIFQGSYGHLHEPEQLEPGDQRRLNASMSWLRPADESHFTAVTAAVGQTVRNFSTVHALLVEATQQIDRTFVYGRYENLRVETEILLFPQIVHRPHPGELVDPVRALTVGAVRDLADIRGFKVGLGGDLVFYDVPELLQFTHGTRIRSGHVFLRMRPPSRGPRMWDRTMGQPMADMAHPSHARP